MSTMTGRDTAFDGKKAFEHLEHLSVTIGPRLTGSPGEHEAARYIARTLKGFRLKVTQQRFPVVTFDNRKCTFEVRQGGRWRKVPAEPVMLSKSTPPRGVEGEIHYAEGGQAEYLTPAMKDKIVLVCGRVAAENRRRLIGFGAKALVGIDPVVREQHRRSLVGEENRRTYGSLPMATIRHLDGLDLVKGRARRGRLVLRNTER